MIIETDVVHNIVQSWDGTVPGTLSIGRLVANTKLALAVHIASRLYASNSLVNEHSKR